MSIVGSLDLFSEQEYGKKLLGISVTKDTLKNKKDTDNAIQHELGHQNEWKNIRKEKRIAEVSDVEMRVFEKLQNKIENEEKKKNPDINALKKYVKQIKLYSSLSYSLLSLHYYNNFKLYNKICQLFF